MHIVSLGGGVQSTTMLLMATHGELTPRPSAAIFADTGWEPESVYAHLRWLEDQTDIPIHRVATGDLRADTWHGRRHDGQPGFLDIPHFIGEPGNAVVSRRQCTTHYKVRPILREARRLAGYPHPGPPPPACCITQWLGISLDEAHRMRDSRQKYVVNRYPLIEAGLKRTDCLAWFEKRYPGQPLRKSSCLGCPFHSDGSWLELYRRGGREWTDTVELDNRLRDPQYPGAPANAYASGAVSRIMSGQLYLHRRGPLEQVIPALHQRLLLQPSLPGLDQDGWGNECEGHCGL